jgi:hypothetical protein
MTTEEAILRLARDGDDEPALIAIAENCGETLRISIRRYFPDGTTATKALNSLLVRISWHAKNFALGRDDPDQWIRYCSALESSRLWNEAQNLCGAPKCERKGDYYH